MDNVPEVLAGFRVNWVSNWSIHTGSRAFALHSSANVFDCQEKLDVSARQLGITRGISVQPNEASAWTVIGGVVSVPQTRKERVEMKRLDSVFLC